MDRVTAAAESARPAGDAGARHREHRRGRGPQGLLSDPGRDLPAGDRHGQGGRRRHVQHPSRRDAGPRGRVGLRQEHDRPGAHPPARPIGRGRPIRRRRPALAQARGPAPDASSDADHLPGPVRLARSTDDGRCHDRRAARDARSRLRRGEARPDRGPVADRRTRSRRTSAATRTSSRAASGSASASPGHSRSNPSSSSATSPSRRSTCRSRARSSISSRISANGSG